MKAAYQGAFTIFMAGYYSWRENEEPVSTFPMVAFNMIIVMIFLLKTIMNDDESDDHIDDTDDFTYHSLACRC